MLLYVRVASDFMPYTCEFDPTTSVRVRRCFSRLILSLIGSGWELCVLTHGARILLNVSRKPRQRCRHPVGNLQSGNTLYYLLCAPILPLRRLVRANHPPMWEDPAKWTLNADHDSLGTLIQGPMSPSSSPKFQGDVRRSILRAESCAENVGSQ